MATTALDIITAAGRKFGLVAEAETLDDEDANNGLMALNAMLDSWQAEQNIVYQEVPNVFPFVSGQQTYTIGSGGNFNMARPPRLTQITARDPNNNDFLIDILNYDEWASIITKETNSTYPLGAYMDNSFPLQNISFWPIPTDPSWSVVLWTWGILQSFPTLTTAISLPPGYERALIFNLAVEWSMEYGKECSATTQRMAITSLGVVKKFNYQDTVLQMQFDPVLTRQGRAWNWLTGY